MNKTVHNNYNYIRVLLLNYSALAVSIQHIIFKRIVDSEVELIIAMYFSVIRRGIMKKNLIILIVILIPILIFVFYPRKVEQGVLVGSDSTYSTFYVDGKLKKFRVSSDFPKLSVLDFKYNLIKAYGFKTLTPKAERVMTKEDKTYDLENSGKTTLSTKTNFYAIDAANSVKPAAAKDVIVGKSNIKYVKNSNGDLKTVLIYPMDFSKMRVAISTTNFSSFYHKKTEIKCEAPAKLYSIRDKFSIDLPKDALVIIDASENNLKITANNKTNTFSNRIYLSGSSLKIQNVVRGVPAFSPTYSGALEFTNVSQSICVINEVDLEDYLRKVVPSEMPLSGGIEALKCQAVAARTYAISDMLLNRFAKLGFYVDDSTQSQVYNNIPTQALSDQAVNATKGQILTYGGTPIDAKYYSTSSGTGVNYKDIWFNADGTSENRPYLVTNNYLSPKQELPNTEAGWLKYYKDTNITAIDSNYPYFRWNVGFSNQGITKTINKSLQLIYSKKKDFITIKQDSKDLSEPVELKDLKDIKVTKRSEGGNALEVAFTFSNAELYVRGDSCIRSILRCSSEYSDEATTLYRHKGDKLTNVTFLPSSFFSVEKTNDKYTLYGGGYGHGVGMSQYGAIELSKKGTKYTDILNTFYKDVKLEKIY